MEEQALQQKAAEFASALPDTTLEVQSHPNWMRHKVHGKVFMLMTDLPGHPVVVLKADPDDAIALRERYNDITPGYHMNKTHWITAEGGGDLDEELLQGLVLDSYRLVVEGLPPSQRP